MAICVYFSFAVGLDEHNGRIILFKDYSMAPRLLAHSYIL